MAWGHSTFARRRRRRRRRRCRFVVVSSSSPGAGGGGGGAGGGMNFQKLSPQTLHTQLSGWLGRVGTIMWKV